MLGDRLAGGDAALLERRRRTRPLRAHPFAVAGEHRMRFEPVERGERAAARRSPAARPRRRPGRCAGRRGSGRGAAGARNLSVIKSFLPPGPRRPPRSSRCHRSRSSALLCASCACADGAAAIDARTRRRGPIALARTRPRATRRRGGPATPTSLRTRLPSVGSLRPSCRCSASIASMKRSVSAGDSAFAGLVVRLQPHGDQRADRRQHREAAVDRVGHAALDIPVRLARLGDRAIEQRLAAARLLR